MTEEWREHSNYPEYRFSSEGRVVRSVDSQKYQKAGDEIFGRVAASGYRQFKLVRRDGSRGEVRANRVICEIFHGPPTSPEHHAAHNDGTRLNNRADNLRWATAKENYADQLRHGTAAIGERTGTAKLSAEIVQSIRQDGLSERGSRVRIAEKYGIGSSQASRIARGESWAHIGGGAGDLNAPAYHTYLSESVIEALRSEHAGCQAGSRAAPGTIDALAEKYGVARHLVRFLVSSKYPGRSALDQKRAAECQ